MEVWSVEQWAVAGTSAREKKLPAIRSGSMDPSASSTLAELAPTWTECLMLCTKHSHSVNVTIQAFPNQPLWWLGWEGDFPSAACRLGSSLSHSQ